MLRIVHYKLVEMVAGSVLSGRRLHVESTAAVQPVADFIGETALVVG